MESNQTIQLDFCIIILYSKRNKFCQVGQGCSGPNLGGKEEDVQKPQTYQHRWRLCGLLSKSASLSLNQPIFQNRYSKNRFYQNRRPL